MKTQNNALKLALDALEKHGDAYLGHSTEYYSAIEKVKEALTQPQRKPLTDEQIRQVMRSLGWTGEVPSDIEFARAIEAAHGIKE